jgi:hypothetical protein
MMCAMPFRRHLPEPNIREEEMGGEAHLSGRRNRMSSSAQVIRAIAALRGLPASEAAIAADPLVPYLLQRCAWEVDCVRHRYDPKQHGDLGTEALDRVLLDLEYESVLGPNADNF